MGLLTQLTGYQTKSKVYPMSSWDGLFQTDPDKVPALTDNPTQGSGWGRTAVNVNAFAKLLEAYRSRGPGGWTDDRWEQARHYDGITYVAIHRANEQLFNAEFQVFEKDDNAPDGKKPVNRKHPGYALVELLEHPNKEDCFGDLISQINLQMDLTGSALTWMVPNRLGKPYELYVIPTAAAMPSPIVNPDFPNGYYRIQPLYPYGPFSAPTPFSAAGAIIPSDWVLRIKYPHPYLRHDGYSPLTGMRLTLDVIESIYRSRWYSMHRGINPTAILNFDDVEGMQGLPPEEVARIHAEWEGSFQGVDNHGKLIVGHPGSKLETFGNKPVDMDYANGWDQETGFAMAGFGISKPAAGMVEETSYSSLFATLKQFHLLTLGPKCARIGAKMTRTLAKFFGDDLIVEVRCPRIDDHEIKERKLTLAAQNKAITYNQLLKELDFPMTDEEWGEQRVGMDEQQQPGAMPGMPGAQTPEMAAGIEPAQPAQPGQDTGAGDLDQQLDAELDQLDQEMEQERPDPGTLGEGSLGPRKTFDREQLLRKALARKRADEDYVEKLIRLSGASNGNGRAH